MLSSMDVLFSSHASPDSLADDTASLTELLYAEKAATAAVTPAATRISGFAISVAHNPDNAPDNVTVEAAAVPFAADNPIAATAACASASDIPVFIRSNTLCASDNAVLDASNFA